MPPAASIPPGGDRRRPARAGGHRVELRTALGLAGRNLVDVASTVIAQLIVLAGRGSTSMRLGTVSQHVLGQTPRPVLVVPEAG